MPYSIPRYTEISHFRAPYKDSLMPTHSHYQDSMLGFGRMPGGGLTDKMPSSESKKESKSKSSSAGSAYSKASNRDAFAKLQTVEAPRTAGSAKGPKGLKAYGPSLAETIATKLDDYALVVLLGPDDRLWPGMPQPTFSEAVSVMAAIAMDPTSEWRASVRKSMSKLVEKEQDPSKREKILKTFAQDIAKRINQMTGFAFNFKIDGTALDLRVSAQGAEKWVAKNRALAQKYQLLSMDPPFALAAATPASFKAPAPAPAAPASGLRQPAPAPSAPGSSAGTTSIVKFPSGSGLLFGMRGFGQAPAPRAPDVPRVPSAVISSGDPLVARAKRMPELFRTAKDAFLNSVICLNKEQMAMANIGYSALAFADKAMGKKYSALPSCVSAPAAIDLLNKNLKFAQGAFLGQSGLKKDIQVYLSQLNPNNIVETPRFSLTTRIAIEDGLVADAKLVAKKFAITAKIARPTGAPLTSSEEKAVEKQVVEESKKDVAKASDSLAKAQQENEDLKKLIEDLKAQVSTPVVSDASMVEMAPPMIAADAAAPVPAAPPVPAAEPTIVAVEPEEVVVVGEESAMSKYGPYVAGAALLGVFGYLYYKNRK